MRMWSIEYIKKVFPKDIIITESIAKWGDHIPPDQETLYHIPCIGGESWPWFSIVDGSCRACGTIENSDFVKLLYRSKNG